MNKKYWLFFIFLLIVIVLLALNTVVPGFGEGVYNTVWLPLANLVGGGFAVVASNPFWHVAEGYITIYALGGLTVILLAWLFWDKLRSKEPAKKLKGVLQDKVRSSSQTIPVAPVKEKTIPVQETTAKIEEVTAEA